MPFADPNRKRAFQAEWLRQRRAGEKGLSGAAGLPAPLRLESALHVRELLEEQINAVRFDPSLGTVERARSINSLAGTLLRAIQAGDVEGRLEALEAVLNDRRAER
jgi:hypothetical protein